MQEIVEGYELSPQQQHVWRLMQEHQGGYCVQWVLEFAGADLADALRRVSARHEILRTALRGGRGESFPLQVILDEVEIPIREVSGGSLKEECERERAFDYEAGESVRCCLMDEQVLIVTLSGLHGDRETLEQLVAELGWNDEEEERLQYAEVAQWQQELLASAEGEKGREYWEQQRVGQESRLAQEESGAGRGEIEQAEWELEASLAAGVKRVATELKAAVWEVVLGSWQVLVWRLSGEADGAIEVRVDGRKYEVLAGVMGPLAKYVPLPYQFERNYRFDEVLKGLKRRIDSAAEWQEYFASDRDDSRIGFEHLRWPANVIAVHDGTDRFKLKLSWVEQAGGYKILLSYDTGRYQQASIERLGEELKELLRSIVANPRELVSELKLLSEREREQLLHEWNQTATDFPSRCLHELFAEQARQRPSATALLYKDEQLSYDELERRANQLAHHLKRLGVGPEVVVGICLERTPQLIVALLAVLKAGGAYLPLDPEYPLERLSFMLEDAAVTVLLSEFALVERLPAHWGYTLCLDEEWEQIAQESEAAPECAAVPENLAYVMYTSGSTGQPKGVLITHRNVVRLVFGNDYAQLDEQQTILQLAPISFDASTFEVWGALLHGAQLQLYPGRVASAVELGEILQPGQHWTLWLTASLFNAVVDEQVQALAAVEQLLVGGEALSVRHIRQAQQELPGVQLINGYGPTEGTTFSCCYRLPREIEASVESIPIGRPIANTEVYILDEWLEPVPVGVHGELYIGGAGVGRGYLQRAGLTAEKFVPDAFSGREGARLYRTGDQCRYLVDGRIEYRGRMDQQVKVRGYRIELGEIEAVLGQHTSVAQCVVNVWETESGDKRLVGYVVWEHEATVTELRWYLGERLPEYMVPGQWVVLEQLPLTANGKVNRGALPGPEASDLEKEQYVGPRTATEEIVAGIWAEVLEVEPVGIHDNFFELGGHSLLATQVISRAREAFGVELPLRSLFDSPTVSSLSQHIEQLRLSGTQNVAPPILSRNGIAEIPLSFAQQRLWFLDQLEPNNPFYNVPAGVRLSGELNVEALERTLSEVVRRHEVLRTSFSTVAGEPRQVISAATEIKLPIEDLSHLEEREQEAARLAGEEAREPFDLSRGPLLRARLIRLAADEHVLLVTLHHIVSDGWSMGVLIREVSALYEAYCAGTESTLPELTIQYADFAVWQRQWLSGAVLEEQLSYWREQLRDLSTLELPADRVRPAVQSHRGATVSFALSREETAALKELSRREGATLFMVLLAAFQVLLSRYSGQNDVVVGTVIANRNHAGTEGLIGFFVNTLPLRIKLDGNPTFQQLLKHVREVCLQAYAHQDVPFEKLVEELQPERDLSRSPIVQVMFALQNAPGSTLQLGNLRLSSAGGQGQTAKHDLLLGLSESDAGLSGALEYSTDLFDAGTIERMQEHFRQLLRAVIAEPELPLAQISMLSAIEREQLLRQWNQTATDFPPLLVHELFAEQARQHPEASALIYKDEQLSYSELERRANQLAHHLQRLGVGPEVVVGICLERTPQMVVALLGVLKAGGAYLPLDPEYPLERLSFMLKDAAAKVLLCNRELLESLALLVEHSLCLDEWMASESEVAPECAAVAENLAYVMYTSGSTGQPKGVMITHHGLRNYLCWARETYQLSEGNGAPLHSSICFDLSVTSLYGPLLGGQCLELQELPQALEQQGNYSLVKLTPAHLSLLREQLAGVSIDESARRYIIGGENLLWSELQWWSEAAAGSRFYNEYGPTETVVGCCVYEFTKVEAASGSVPIGGAIANTEMYVLDEELEPVPVGVSGEIYIGGAGVARGYLQRAGLTAERFIPDAFSGRVGARLYRSGDVGRYLADGNLEYRGRLDQQVKVRGYRIELGEIEAVLGQHAAVAQCVVNLRETESGDKRLVCYVVWAQEATVTELREYLSERLPEYMVPGQWVMLEELPIAASGKVDRKALPAPEQSELVSERYVGPRTVTEEIMAGIWAEVLEIEQVGMHDNFFALGGHSLLATQLISRARDAFAVELQVRSLFESPTVSSLSYDIEQLRLSGTQSVAPPILPRDGVAEIPLSFAQQRLWFLDQLEPQNPVFNIPTGVRLNGELNVEALERTLSEVVRRHEVLRTSFITVAGEPRQVINAATEIKLPLEDLSHLSVEEREQEAQRRAGEEAREPFDLSRGPLLRMRLLRLAADEHVLLVTIHHIVSDGWSMGVLIREVSALYEAYCTGAESPLPELAIQYADFAMWQRQWLSGAVLKEQLNYWREQLRDLSPLELPADRVRPAVQSHKGATVSFSLGREETAVLKALSRREGATLFMVLLAAFQVLLSRYSGQRDIVIGTDVANRNRAETEGLIGFFVNQLVLRTELSGAKNFVDVLQRVREVCLKAYEHQDVPFEKLVEELQPERDLSRSPMFQVKFIFQNVPGSVLQMGNLRLSSAGGQGQTTKHDLLLGISESDAGLGGALEYSTDLFDANTIERWVEHLQQLLRAIIATPELPLTQLSMLSAVEREQLLHEWNQTATDFPPLLVHELFAEQARQHPESTALRHKDERLSYDELERRANQLAHHLQRLGVGPEVVVGICLERTPQMVVALLAVLKAGGAYLPLDPSYPLERLAFMLEDAAVTVLLTELAVVERLPAHWGYTLCLDEEWERIATESEAGPECAAVAENLAYVMYTSGSTGQPKGVMITHHGLRNYLCWARDTYQLSEGNGAPLHSSICFDLSVTSLYGPLLGGQCLELRELQQALEQQGDYSLVKLTPAHLSLLREQLTGVSIDRSARRYIIGGENLLWSELQWWSEAAAGSRFYNEYGPTETVVGCCVYEFTKVEAASGSVPIGRAIANTEMYVLDEELEPVPVGVSGEIYIGGAGVARGYLQRAGLTAERFIPDAFSGRVGARLYRSGDVGRYLADGNLEYRGRLDQQVKVRGYRIELGEIEAVLGQHAAVAQCVVNLRETESGDKRLVGYVVWAQEATVAELREYLSERLPEYMVPGQWVVLEELPLAASGKVDRKALPAPEQSELVSERYVGPRTVTEEIMAGIWAEVLEVEQVGVHDNFFALGGHSLLATQLISRARDAFAVELQVRSLFESPTVSSLSYDIEQLRLSGTQSVAPPILPRDGVAEIPLSFAQQRLWFLDQLEPQNPFFNIPTGVRLNGELNVEALERTLSEVVRRHEVLRTSFITVAGEPRQVINAATEIKLPLEDLSHLSVEEREEEARRRAGEEARQPFDLSRGPLLRMCLLRLAADEHVLLVTIHHIVSDGWSMGVLIREVSALYEAYCTGAESPLPELAIQYADFALWQRQWLSGAVLEEQLNYWREQLRDLSPLELPTDRVRPAVQSHKGATVSFSLGREETAALKELSRREGATLFIMLLAVFKSLLHYYSKQNEIAVSIDIANRKQVEVEGLIGFFINVLLLRSNLSGNPTFRELVRRVCETTLGAYAHQDLPFERLIEELRPERSLRSVPLVRVKFSFQNTPQAALKMSTLRLSPLWGSSHSTAKLDLTLYMAEVENGLTGTFSYDTDLFNAATIKRISKLFEVMVSKVVAHPDIRLNEILATLAAAESEQVVVDKKERRDLKLKQFTKVTPKALTLSQVDLK